MNFLQAYEPAQIAILGGLIVGFIFGGASLLGHFCLRSLVITQIREVRVQQTRQWMVAVLVALVGVMGLQTYMGLDLQGSIYRMDVLNPLGVLVGGLLFGAGMVLARGCLARHLVLGGAGNIRSWVLLLVAGLSAYATARGIFAHGRLFFNDLWVVEHDPTQYQFLVLGVLVLLVLVGLVYAGKDIWQPKDRIKEFISAILIGLCVVAAFYVTGIIGLDEFDPIPAESLRFTLPLGDGLVYLITQTGSQANFAIALIAGTIAGSFIMARFTKQFEWRSFENAPMTLRYLLGGVMLGIGGVMALGCTIGQGLVGIATLSSSAPLAILGIVIGGRVTLQFLQYRDSHLLSISQAS